MKFQSWKGRALSVVIVLIVVTAGAVLYVTLSRHNDLQIKTKLPKFSNASEVMRADGKSLPVDSLESTIERLMKAAKVYGLAISITNDGQTVYQQYFGYKNFSRSEKFEAGTIFYGASLSKPILADVTVQLVNDGVMNLDTPLYKYLPKPLYKYKTTTLQRLLGAAYVDYSDLRVDERYNLITARMCLSHTSGLPNWRWLEGDRKLKIKFNPGSRYIYSGEGMHLLQFVIEKLTNRKFDELAREKVFTPLQMSRSSYVWQEGYEGNYCVGHDGDGNNLRIPKSNTANAAGSLSTTLEDYAKYVNAVLSQNERYKEMTSPQIRIRSRQQFGPNALVDVADNDSIQLSYGLGFGLYQTPYGKVFFKEGHLEGWQHYVVGIPDKKYALILMANSDNAEGIYKELIELISGNRYTPWYWEGYIPYNSPGN
ncbi:serine hydrolase domain-containing protein [Chryseolinea sp. T2]|uniref:serine hydrolase domain-containing protein n=1 Tax=Chryseolinea sp. T2 TaxID=3129255 RepID=UPI0030786F72